jgi:lipoprotein-anchoring transpeptidase ErfK/SrfK
MMPNKINPQLIKIIVPLQSMYCYENDVLIKTYPVSTAKNGVGEQMGSECTPRGWHQIHRIIGLDNEVNSVFVGRVWTGEHYDCMLAHKFPERDWILTRILQLDGLEPGRNKGGQVDSLARYIYIHGTPDTTSFDKPASHGSVRMRNIYIIALANWVKVGSLVCIE